MKRTFLSCAGALAFPVVMQAQDTPKLQPVAPAATATTLPLKRDPRPTKPAITVDDLMTRLYIFADDSMMGRDAGTLGSVKATDYLAAEAKRLGLVPAGENGTYFQTLPLRDRKVDPLSTFIAGTAPLTFGSEWAISGNTTINNAALESVYGGVIGKADKLTAEQAAGKLVLLSMPTSQEAIGMVLGNDALVPASAAAVGILVPAQVQGLLGFVMRPSVTVVDSSAPSRLFIGAAAVKKLFSKPLDSLSLGDAGATIAVNAIVDMKEVANPARNVIGILPGSDPMLKSQYVAIGAHSDHIGMSRRAVDHDSVLIFNRIVRPAGAENEDKMGNAAQFAEVNAELATMRLTSPTRRDSIFNGADDDGSGSMSVLEIAEYMASMKTKPRRSTLFVWHVGEEKGLWGSAYFTGHPTVPRDSIVAQLNMDMVGRGSQTDQTGMSADGKELRGGPDYLQLVGSRRLSTELGDIVERINTSKKHNFSFDYAMDANGHPMNIYCRSDHYEYARYGIPVAFVTTGGHSAYHQLTDEPQYIDYPHMLRVTKLITDIAMELGNAAKRPLVNMPKMDPKGRCKQ